MTASAETADVRFDNGLGLRHRRLARIDAGLTIWPRSSTV